MIRVLDRNGLCMESFCNHVDSSGTGTIRKAHFAKILKNIGFPFSWIDLNEVLLRYSNAPKFDIIDYQTFLNDAGVTSKSEKLQLDLNLDVKSTQQTGWRTYTRVLLDVKRMLLDSMLNTGKQKDDIYGMFAVWDKTNTGAVTATQFLRVLVQLQVDLRDHDQDFLVDLLDTTSMGRIDYDNLLDFCFSGFDRSVSNMEDREASSDGEDYLPSCLVEDSNLFARSNQSSKDSAPVSIIYRDDVMETRSPKAFNEADVSENQNMSNRPITAYARIQSSPKNSCKFNYDEKECSNRNSADVTNSGVAKSMSSIKKKLRTASEYGISHHTERAIDVDDQAGYSAGIENGYLSSKESKTRDEFSSVACEKGTFDADNESMHTADFSSRRNANSSLAELDDCNLRITVPRGEYSPNSSLGNISNPHTESTYGDVVGKSKRGRFERGTGEYESDINDYESWSRRRRDGHEGSHEDFKFLNSVQVLPTFHSELPCLTLPDLGDVPYFSPNDFSARRDSPACSAREPMENLNHLASQTLATVRDMVLRRHKAEGKSLSVIFRHFDRTAKSYFDAKDFMTATADLRIEISEIVANLAVAQIARDGKNTVTYGEFHVYILDPLHDALEREIVVNLAEQLEKQGRGFHTTLKTLFWDEEKIMRGGLPNAKQKGGFVSTKVFVAVLKKFGLKLSVRDLERVVARFDINNDGHSCNATRFVKMVERSEQWIAVEENITNQEVALKEASILRAELTAQKSGLLPDQTGSFGGRQLSEEMISMAESLGIKVISEQYLLWIVRHALNVPLPTPWALVKVYGMSYYSILWTLFVCNIAAALTLLFDAILSK
jgi:Ca2+-binding EF-hand superfamily protein